MADVNRSVKIFINGKEVEGTIKGIKAAYAKVNKELDLMDINSEEYNAKIKDLGKLGSVLDEHRNKLNGIRKASEGMSLGTGLGIATGIGAITMAIDKVSEWSDVAYEAFKGSEEAAVRVEQKMSSLGNTTGLTMEQIADTATEIMKKTTYDDDQILNDVTNNLLNFKNITGQVFLDAQMAAADYAANSGKSLEEASIAVGQALENPEKAAKKLRAMNILLTKSEQDHIKTLQEQGRIQEAQIIILDKINERYEGQAEALAATDTGKVEQQKNAWGEVYEQVGAVVAQLRGAIAPAFIWMAEKAGIAFEWLLDNAIYPVWDALKDLFGAMFGGINVTGFLKGAVQALGGVIKGAVVIFTTLVGWISSYYRWANETVKSNTFLSASFNSLGKVVKFVMDFLMDLPATFAAIGKGIEVIWNAVTKGDFSKNIGTEMKKAFDTTRSGIKKINEERQKLTATGVSGVDPARNYIGETDEQKKAKKAAKKAASDREKETKDLKDHLQKLQDIVAKHNDDVAEMNLSASEKAIDAIRDKYAKEIAEATELEAKGVKSATDVRLNLERLRDQEITNYKIKAAHDWQAKMDELNRDEINKVQATYEEKIKTVQEMEAAGILTKDLAQENIKLLEQKSADEIAQIKSAAAEKEIEAKQKVEEEKLAIENDYKQKALDLLGTTAEQALAAVTKQYDDLLAAAEKYGLKESKLTELRAKKQKALMLEQMKETERGLGVMGSAFSDLGSAVGDMIDQSGDKMSDWIAFQKMLTIAQIAFDTARAITSIIRAATDSSFSVYDAVGQMIAGVAAVIANIAKAKALLSTPVPKYEQKYKGGYEDVIGADDGRRYRAEQLGVVSTGMLPDHPVLVHGTLASERGREYFVANEDLKKPAVASLVSQIEDIRTGRQVVSQRANGGYSDGANVVTASTGGSILESLLMENMRAINRLNKILDRGIYAVLDDGTIVKMQKRYRDMNETAGGVL